MSDHSREAVSRSFSRLVAGGIVIATAFKPPLTDARIGALDVMVQMRSHRNGALCHFSAV